jgi:Tfp pilus assembly protein PilF
LEWNLAELYRQAGNTAEIGPVLDRIVELGNDKAEDTLVRLLKWLTEYKSWEILDLFLGKHQVQLAQYKRPLYYAALARLQQGKHDLAEQLASDAVAAPSQTRLDSYFSARDLEEHNQFDWAVREYHKAIEKQPSETGEPFLARVSLANLLHDHELEKEAAEVLDPLVKSVQGEAAIAQLYQNIRNFYSGRAIDLPEPDVVVARYHFYRACQYQLEKDLVRAKDELDLAIKFNAQDADVLIAMYNFPEGDAKWRNAIRQRVRQMAQQFQQQIDEEPSDPIPYNQWAWLVSNTEGDFQRALRYSQRSLQLDTSSDSGSGSYLDTLGRCYFAVGDYEKAVKYEREAITKVGYMQVMQRQLALFEKALADKNAGAKSEPAKSN